MKKHVDKKYGERLCSLIQKFGFNLKWKYSASTLVRWKFNSYEFFIKKYLQIILIQHKHGIKQIERLWKILELWKWALIKLSSSTLKWMRCARVKC